MIDISDIYATKSTTTDSLGRERAPGHLRELGRGLCLRVRCKGPLVFVNCVYEAAPYSLQGPLILSGALYA